MNLKQFLKPNKRKIIIFSLLIFVIFVLPITLSFLTKTPVLSSPVFGPAFYILFFSSLVIRLFLTFISSLLNYIKTGYWIFLGDFEGAPSCLIPFCSQISYVFGFLMTGITLYLLSCLVTLLISKSFNVKRKILILIGMVLIVGIAAGLFWQRERYYQKMVELEHCIDACYLPERHSGSYFDKLEPQCLEKCLNEYGVDLKEYQEWWEKKGF